MNESKPSPSVAKRDKGLALADALVERSRRSQPLSAMAHSRVKQRLQQSLSRRRIDKTRWVRSMVIAGLLLVCGTAFGIVIDRYVAKPRIVPNPPHTAPPDSVSARNPRAPKRASVPTWRIPTLPPEKEVVPRPQETRPVSLATSPTTSPTTEAGSKPMARVVASKKMETLRAVVPSEPSLAKATPDPSSVAPTASSPEIHQIPTPAKNEVRPLREVPARTNPPPDPGEEPLLASAVRALRVEQNSVAALSALDRYQAHYPHGRLLIEASILRVDALLKLDRWNEALLFLDTLDLTHLPGGAERCLQRGELRLRHQRWRDAMSDFDWVLSHQQDDYFVERALQGRMQCRVRLGDERGARADAVIYLRSFPSGPFVGHARAIKEINHR